MSEVRSLISEVKNSREKILESVRSLSSEQGTFKASDDEWSIAEILEHLVLAEQGGINLIWKAADGLKRGVNFWDGESTNSGLSIDQIIENTWKTKEKAPESATPRIGGPIKYWVAALEACQPLLENLGSELESSNLSEIIYPHFLSGPLDARQRLEFIRFHLDRHIKQIERVMKDSNFPA